MDEEKAERVAIGVTEVCTNILKHAVRGEILARADPEGRDLEILALDRGPGMTSLEQCLRDGFSTGGSPGQGLGAIVRLSTLADFYSVLGQGTAVLARWSLNASNGHHSDKLQIGVVNVPKPGQEVCGDSWGVAQTADHTVVLVADGLGHGPEAQAASQEATRMLHLNPELTPRDLIERCHHALRSTRGAAVAVSRIDRVRGKVTYCGVGNISAQLYSGSKAGQHLVSVNGTAGHQMQRLQEFNYPWPEHGILVMHSDGLSTGTNVEAREGLALRDPSLIAGVLYRDFSRGNDDATVVVAKAA
jgi:hypothetical protein